MRKLLPTVLLSLLLAAVMTSFGAVVAAQDAEPARGGRLELVALNDPRTLDNSQAVDTIEYNTVAGALYEGLYHFTPEGELVPALADGMPSISDDGLVYTFRLKPGAMFAGPDFEPRAVTAADVAYGMTRALDPTPEGAPAPSWGSGYLFPIKGAAAFNAGEAESVEGIEVIDDDTLQVTLEAPTSTFLLGLTIATSWPVPPEAVAERGEDFGNRPVGAGPFYVKEWNKGSDITLARNEGYVDPALPYLDEIRVDVGVDENTQVLRLESGQADGVYEPFTIGPAGLRLLEQAPDVTVEDAVGPRIYYLALENSGMFGDRDLRLAVAHALTRDFTAQFGDLAKPWNQLMGSATTQSDPDGTRIYPHDPELAREYLASGGYDGTPVKVIYDVTDPYGSANATALRQDLEAVGFNVDLAGLQPGEFFGGAVYDPEARDLSSTYWSADYPDAQDYISTNFVCGQFLNISNFCDEDIDAAFYATEQMPFGPERDAALLEVQQALIDEVAGVPIMEVTPQVVYGPRVGAMPTLATYAPYDWKRAWVKADA
ncbi:MAG TPA: ABC transporter substrate-binding protein [Anaerolineae bacterium]|nr:ABC transporter substrate-binding protein [Anaerolineae bacterium]